MSCYNLFKPWIMHYKILPLIVITFFLFGCSNKYKITQTPDDVYYSPIRGIDEEMNIDNHNTASSSEYRELIMSRHDSRWRNFDDDYNYNYVPYHYSYTYGYYYNPYYYPVYNYGITQTNPKNNTPRTTNLGSYTFHNVNTGNPKTSGPVKYYVPGRDYNNSNLGNSIRNSISPDNNSSGHNNTRTYNPSIGSSGGGSGTPITRPSRNK